MNDLTDAAWWIHELWTTS